MIFVVFLLALPFLEIALFIAIGDEIGFFNAVLLCMASVLVGGFLVRQQGLKTARSLQDSLNRGEMPVAEMFAGICMFMAGILFIIPGFLTDMMAVLLLIPPIRAQLGRYLGRYFIGEPVIMRGGRPQERNADIIDAEFVEVSSEEIRDEPPRLN